MPRRCATAPPWMNKGNKTRFLMAMLKKLGGDVSEVLAQAKR